MKHPIDFDSLDQTKPVSQHAKELGIPFTTLKRRLEEAGLYEKFPRLGGQEASRRKALAAREAYAKEPKHCAQCDGELAFEQRGYRFCSTSCGSKANYTLGRREAQGAEIKRRMREGTWKKPTPPRTPKSPREHRPCKQCGKEMELLPSQSHRKFCSHLCAAKGYEGGSGGYREGSGRGKSGWYRGVFCNSTWELAWVMYHLDHGLAFTRNAQGFEYVFEGAIHRYYPDFIMNDGTYVEVKGYSTPQWHAKTEQFPHSLQVFYKADMKPILDYVKSTYGTDFVRLYEGNPHDEKRSQCVICGKPCKRKCCSQKCGGMHSANTRKDGLFQTLSPSSNKSSSQVLHT